MLKPYHNLGRKSNKKLNGKIGRMFLGLIVVCLGTIFVEEVPLVHRELQSAICENGVLKTHLSVGQRILCQVETELETQSFEEAFGTGGSSFVADYDTERPSDTVAFVVTVPSCREDASSRAAEDDPGDAFYDAAAVLRDSICNCTAKNPDSGSQYDNTMYAIIHPDATTCAGPTPSSSSEGNRRALSGGSSYNYDRVAILEELGFWVIIWGNPVQLEDIPVTQVALRQDMESYGGQDLMQLYAYNLTSHPVAVMMDFDTIFTGKTTRSSY